MLRRRVSHQGALGGQLQPTEERHELFPLAIFWHDTLPSSQVISDRESLFLPKKRNDPIYEKKKILRERCVK